LPSSACFGDDHSATVKTSGRIFRIISCASCQNRRASDLSASFRVSDPAMSILNPAAPISSQ